MVFFLDRSNNCNGINITSKSDILLLFLEMNRELIDINKILIKKKKKNNLKLKEMKG